MSLCGMPGVGFSSDSVPNTFRKVVTCPHFVPSRNVFGTGSKGKPPQGILQGDDVQTAAINLISQDHVQTEAGNTAERATIGTGPYVAPLGAQGSHGPHAPQGGPWPMGPFWGPFWVLLDPFGPLRHLRARDHLVPFGLRWALDPFWTPLDPFGPFGPLGAFGPLGPKGFFGPWSSYCAPWWVAYWAIVR